MIYSKCFFILFTQLKPYIIQLIQSHVNLVSFWWNIFWSWKDKLYKIIFEYKKVVEQFFQSLNDIRNYGDIKEEITFIVILQIKIFKKLLFFIHVHLTIWRTFTMSLVMLKEYIHRLIYVSMALTDLKIVESIYVSRDILGLEDLD